MFLLKFSHYLRRFASLLRRRKTRQEGGKDDMGGFRMSLFDVSTLTIYSVFLLNKKSILIAHLPLGHHKMGLAKPSTDKGLGISMLFCYHKNTVKLVLNGAGMTLLLCNK